MTLFEVLVTHREWEGSNDQIEVAKNKVCIVCANSFPEAKVKVKEHYTNLDIINIEELNRDVIQLRERRW